LNKISESLGFFKIKKLLGILFLTSLKNFVKQKIRYKSLHQERNQNFSRGEGDFGGFFLKNPSKMIKFSYEGGICPPISPSGYAPALHHIQFISYRRSK
jgi:hypothetical protein